MSTINLDTTTIAILTILGVLVLLALVAWAMQHRKQSDRLQQRFGPEYTRTMDRMGGSREKAEAELLARERRVKRLHIVALSPAEAERYQREWQRLQGQFVDNPSAALAEADRLVRELMLQRGYPMGDFDRHAADISVDHANVVSHYRAARAITLLAQLDDVNDTEELRKAVVHYRALFDDLLEVTPDGRRTTRHSHTTPHMEARS